MTRRMGTQVVHERHAVELVLAGILLVAANTSNQATSKETLRDSPKKCRYYSSGEISSNKVTSWIPRIFVRECCLQVPMRPAGCCCELIDGNKLCSYSHSVDDVAVRINRRWCALKNLGVAPTLTAILKDVQTSSLNLTIC